MRHHLRAVRPLIWAAALTCVAACESNQEAADLEVLTRINEESDLNAFERFEIIDPLEFVYESPPPNYDKINGAILGAIEREATDVGLVRARPAELAITPIIFFLDVEGNLDRYGAYWGYDEEWIEGREEPVRGTLAVDVVDLRGTNEDETDDVLVFRGAATDFRAESLEGLENLIDQAVTEMFESWPTAQ